MSANPHLRIEFNYFSNRGDKRMYEQPKLNRVGKAQEVILGLVPGGYDIDTNWVFECMEFADESEDEPGPPPIVR
jgi:hypothetical protein